MEHKKTPPKLGPQDATNVFQYLEWQDLYQTEKPFQILLDISEDAPEQRRHNLKFHEGPSEVIHDVRGKESDYNLDDHGFKYIKRTSSMQEEDFASIERVEKVFLPELEQMKKEVVDDVDQVYIYDYRRRQTGEHPLHGKAIDFGNKLSPLGPASQPHLDQSPKSVVQRVMQFLPDEASRLLKGRVRLINMWRPTNGEVHHWPLAVCDASTLPEKQLIECERIRRSFLGSTMYVMYTQGINRHYLSCQDNEDMLLFKTFDSDRNVAAKYCAHGAFDWKKAPTSKIRESIEVRALVFTYAENVKKGPTN